MPIQVALVGLVLGVFREAHPMTTVGMVFYAPIVGLFLTAILPIKSAGQRLAWQLTYLLVLFFGGGLYLLSIVGV